MIMNCTQFTYICLCRWMMSPPQGREINKQDDELFQIKQVIRKIQETEDHKDKAERMNIREEIKFKKFKENSSQNNP